MIIYKSDYTTPKELTMSFDMDMVDINEAISLFIKNRGILLTTRDRLEVVPKYNGNKVQGMYVKLIHNE